MIRVENHRLLAESATTIAEFEDARLVSLRDAVTGEEFIDKGTALRHPALILCQAGGGRYPLGVGPRSKITPRRLSDYVGEIVIEDWAGDAALHITIDPDNGDIRVEPSAISLMRGVSALHYLVCPRHDLMEILPIQQGCRIPQGWEVFHGRAFPHTSDWEAAFAVLEGAGSGFSVQAWDREFFGKSLVLGEEDDPHVLGFVTEASGPVAGNETVGSLTWRLAAYRGDWRVPVRRYRDWLWDAYRLDKAAAARPQWVQELKLGISWCPTNIEMLRELAKRIDPKYVVLHWPEWRDYVYDEDYPRFVPADWSIAFAKEARAMGYHIMPHCNFRQMSPYHPLFAQVVGTSPRRVLEGTLRGWSWLEVDGHYTSLGPPQSYSQVADSVGDKILVDAHPGLSPWRHELTRQIAACRESMDLDVIFTDVSHVSDNSDPWRVENLTVTAGTLALGRELTDLFPGFAIGGEGRNEINAQVFSVHQLHLLAYAHNRAGVGEDISWLLDYTLPVMEEITRGLCRGMGYARGGNRAQQRMCFDAAVKQGAVPTFLFDAPRSGEGACEEFLADPDGNFAHLLELAGI